MHFHLLVKTGNKVKMSSKDYNRKRPSHPDDAHTKNKRYFKRKGRKRNRKYYKKKIKSETELKE